MLQAISNPKNLTQLAGYTTKAALRENLLNFETLTSVYEYLTAHVSTWSASAQVPPTFSLRRIAAPSTNHKEIDFRSSDLCCCPAREFDLIINSRWKERKPSAPGDR
jgi:hypothetical protein